MSNSKLLIKKLLEEALDPEPDKSGEPEQGQDYPTEDEKQAIFKAALKATWAAGFEHKFRVLSNKFQNELERRAGLDEDDFVNFIVGLSDPNVDPATVLAAHYEYSKFLSSGLG